MTAASEDVLALQGRVAIVTGAAGLLGHEHCVALARAGASVVALDRDSGALSALGERLERGGVRALCLPVDVTDADTLDQVREVVVARFGRIDVLVNNAAIDDKFQIDDALEESSFERYSLERFRRQLDVNVSGVFLCCQRFGLAMLEAGSGSIVNVASTYGLTAPQQDLYRDRQGNQLFYKGPAYPASKAAVIQFTRYLACYWGRRGIRVNSLSPGGVFSGQDEVFVQAYSERTPLGRMAQASDYRGALIFLASDHSLYMTGANLVVDGGWTAW
jgi:NAD(P)-dependent dehydrogenase (short-subunit alcohol dehydrogenase family)